MVCLDGDTHESVLTEPDSPALQMTAGPSSNSQIPSFAVSGVLPSVQMRFSGSERESVDHQTAIHKSQRKVGHTIEIDAHNATCTSHCQNSWRASCTAIVAHPKETSGST